MNIRTLLIFAIGGMGSAYIPVASADIGDGVPPTIRWHLAGGYSAPTGPISDYLQGGYVLSGGFTYGHDDSPLGLRGDVSISSHNATNSFLDFGSVVTGVQVDSGSGQFFSFSLGPSYTVPFIGRTSAYGFAQVGIYHSSLQLSQTALFQGDYCDPYFGYCDYGVYPGENLVYDDSRTRFGWNVGFGVEFPRYFSGAWFIEASYHRLTGSQPMSYVPIEIGIRF